MKKTKFLLALALVCVALSFGFKAQAQNVPVTMKYHGDHMGQFGFNVLLIDNVTDEYYFLERGSSNYDGEFYLGSVPPGNYTVFITLIGSGVQYDLSYWGNGLSDTKTFQSSGDTLVSDNVTINDDYFNNDAGLYLTFEDYH